MPRRNRVDPWGHLVASPARGTFFGNRGVLHDDEGRITRDRISERRWIICLLDFKGRKRELLQPGRYTELFFLDEATALAAGHRPCAECRRDRFNAYRDACSKPGAGQPSAGELDRRLNAERLQLDGSRPTPPAICGDLPDGTMVVADRNGDAQPELIWASRLWTWRIDGYGASRPMDRREEVALLTPPFTVGAIAAGYEPQAAVS